MTVTKPKQHSPNPQDGPGRAQVLGSSILDPDFDDLLVDQADAEWARWRWPERERIE